MRRILLTFILLALAGPQSLAATGTTGKALFEGCRTAAETREMTFQSGVCLGTIVTLLNLTQETVAREPYVICKPPGASTGQALRVVVRYMAANPQVLQKELAAIALNAMQLVWPCGKTK